MFSPALLPLLLLGGTLLASRTDGNENVHRLHHLKKCLEARGSAHQLIDPKTSPSYYKKLNRQWNLRIPKVFPISYFLPSETLDVQRLVRCGSEAKVHLIPNSGSHSYEAISFGSEKTVVIDFRRMAGIAVDGDGLGGWTASIQPGALVAQINAQLHREGGFGIPMGECLLVGLGGHALGGGVGLYAPLFGLTLDNVLELEMVDAAGRAVRASRRERPELFWALRGVGPGLIGIVTQFRLKLFRTRDLRITYVSLSYPVGQFGRVAEALEAWRSFTARNMPYVRSGMHVTSDNFEPVFPPASRGNQAYAIHFWDPLVQPETNVTFLKSVRQYFPSSGDIQIQYLSHLEFQALTGYAAVNFPRIRNGTSGHLQPPSANRLENHKKPPETESKILAYFQRMRKGIETPLYVKIRSFFINTALKEHELGSLTRLLRSIPNYVLIQLEGRTGAAEAVPQSATAYIHRGNRFFFSVQYEGPDESRAVRRGMAWLEKFWTAAQFLDGGESYQGTPDLDDKDFLRRYYGRSLPRLLAVKQTWDPSNYFRSPLSLPV